MHLIYFFAGVVKSAFLCVERDVWLSEGLAAAGSTAGMQFVRERILWLCKQAQLHLGMSFESDVFAGRQLGASAALRLTKQEIESDTGIVWSWDC